MTVGSSSQPPRAYLAVMAKADSMCQKLLQINYAFHVPAADLAQALMPVAQSLAGTPSLRWKIWLINEVESEAGGIYLFDDESAAQAFLNGV